MASAGSLTLDIFPSLKGFSSELLSQVTGPSAEAGSRAGAELSRGFVAGSSAGAREASRVISAEVTAGTRAAGSEAGRNISTGVTSGARTASSEASRELSTGIAAGGRTGATAAGRELSAGLSTGARTASAEASRTLTTELASGGRTGGAEAGRGLDAGLVTAARNAGGEAGRVISTSIGEAVTKTSAEASVKLREGMATGAREGTERARGSFATMGKSIKEMAELIGAMWLAEKTIDFFKEGIAGAQKMQSIYRQTAAAIRSTGGAADVTSPEVKELSEHLADLSGKTDDVVQSGVNILLTFPSIRNEAGKNNDVFNQAGLAATNLSARMGTDLRSSMVLVGKALNDPIKGVTSLRRVGVQLSTQQQKQVKEFMASGESMKAQKIILGELNREFAGSAAAAATPAQKMHVAWDRLQATTGEKLLPAVTKLATVFTTSVVPALSHAFDWTEKNWGTVKLLGGAALGLVTAYMAVTKITAVIKAFQEATWLAKLATDAWKIATVAWTFATEGSAAAMAAFDAAFEANPIGLIITGIVVAIAALVAGIYMLVTHWHQVMNALGAAAMWLWHNAIEPAWHGIQAAISAVYNAVIRPVLSAISVGLHALGAAASWLWHNAIQPAFNGISLAARILFAIVATVLITPLYLLFHYVLAPVFTWLYHNVVQPMFSAIGRMFSWLYSNVAVPIGNAIVATLRWLGSIFSWLYTNIVRPVFTFIGTIFRWLYSNVVVPIGNAVMTVIRALGAVFNWLWNNVVHPVFTFIGNIFNWIYRNIVIPVVEGIKIQIREWGAIFHWIHDNVIKPVSSAIGKVIHGIGQVFSDVVDWIKRVWGKITDIAKIPINFVIKFVYNQGIVPVWNGIAGVFGLGKLKPAATLAGGGVLPGYAPGRDTIPVLASPGEGWLVPEAVQAIGPRNILALNDYYSGGRKPGSTAGYSGGGIVGMAGGGILGDIWGGIKSAAGVVWHGISDAFNWVKSIAGDIGGGVRKLFDRITGTAGHIALDSSSSGGSFLDALKHIPSKVIGSVIDAVKNFFSGGAGSMVGVAGVIPVGQHKSIIDAALAADGVPRDQWGKWEVGMNTLIQRESSWNAGSVNNWDSNAARGTPSGGLAQVIGPTFASNRNPSLPNNLLDPVANVAASINYIMRTYGDITRVQQANANLPPKGYAGGGIVPFQVLDSGGALPPGFSLAYNGTRRPEPVVPAQRWETLTARSNEPQQITGTLSVNGLDAHIDGRIQTSQQALGSALLHRSR